MKGSSHLMQMRYIRHAFLLTSRNWKVDSFKLAALTSSEAFCINLLKDGMFWLWVGGSTYSKAFKWWILATYWTFHYFSPISIYIWRKLLQSTEISAFIKKLKSKIIFLTNYFGKHTLILPIFDYVKIRFHYLSLNFPSLTWLKGHDVNQGMRIQMWLLKYLV